MEESKENKENKENMGKTTDQSFRFMVFGTIIMLFAAIITGVIFTMMNRTFFSIKEETYVPYESHYAFIAEDPDSDFWAEVYEAAMTEAEKNGIYLEDMHSSLNSNYSSTDLLRIAKNSSVDGIIYSGENSEETAELINAAVDNGIGVVILQNDVDTSKRQCFVGINYYELGQLYAEEIKKIQNSGNSVNTIEIIVEDNMSEGVSNLITMAIEDKLTEDVSSEDETAPPVPEISILRVDAEDKFGAEESIRRVFISNNDLPDVLLCLNSVYTQCAYQAVVDYNAVGNVQILGYFANDDILEAVDKQIIYSTILIDTVEMGELSVGALHEYNEMGYTNSYIPINMETINYQKADALLKEKDQSNETD